MAYPDTNLTDGTVDSDYGGQTALEFGGPAWAWVNAVLIEAQRQLVRLGWKPYVQRKCKASDGGVVGDVYVNDLNGPESDYSLVLLSGVTYAPATTRRFGLLAEAVSAGADALFITEGAGIPPAIHGLSAGAVGYVRMSTTTGRLERADGTPGEIIVGDINSRGFVRLFPVSATNE